MIVTSGVQKIHIRRSRGWKPGWKLVIDGKNDKNHYFTWEEARDSAIARLRRRVMRNLIDACVAEPGEYHAVDASHLSGRPLWRKRTNVIMMGKYEGLRLDTWWEHDGQNPRRYQLYVAGVNQ